jgi:hypothetical protein
MNDLFKELMIEGEDDFEDLLNEKAMEYTEQNDEYVCPHLILLPIDINQRTSYDRLEELNAKKVLISNASLFIKVKKSVDSDFGLERYLNGEKEVLLKEKEAYHFVIDDLDALLDDVSMSNMKNDYYITEQIAELDKLIEYPSVIEEEIIEIKFDSKIVEMSVFLDKIKDVQPYDIITNRIYLIQEQKSVFDELYILKFLKTCFEKEKLTKDELSLIVEKYLQDKSGLEKYSLRILSY